MKSNVVRVLAAACFGLSLTAAAPALAGGMVNVQPVKICRNDGTACANAAGNLFAAETNKIWAQAGITFNFLDFTTINDTADQNFTTQMQVDDFFAAHPGKSADADVITMWFTNNIFNAYGEVNAIGGDMAIIDISIFTIPRIDTIAHELGHNLGLRHDDPGVLRDYLMRAGDRFIPNGIGNITPDGLGYDKLTAGEIATAMADGKVHAVPEPATWALMLLGFGALGALARRRRTVVC